MIFKLVNYSQYSCTNCAAPFWLYFYPILISWNIINSPLFSF